MKSTDSRARRHFRRDQLALRMVRLGARSSTVYAWTGLSPNRIRTLVQQHTDLTPIRHRGQPPRRVTYFFRTRRITYHAGTLGSLFELFQALPETGVGIPAHSFRTITRGEALCEAYELYGAMVHARVIRFEHAILLATALADGEEISLQGCPQCEARMLVDHFAIASEACPHCRPSAHLPTIPGSPVESPPAGFRRPQRQLRLFAPLEEGLRPTPPSDTDAPTPPALATEGSHPSSVDPNRDGHGAEHTGEHP